MSTSFLDDLGVAFGTDKSSLLHNYLVEYEKWLPKRGKVKWVMEIGVQRGDKKWHARHPVPSLKMWSCYFPNAEIVGFDIKDIDYEEERLIVLPLDQSSEHQLELIEQQWTDIDVIIDDGSHRPDDQWLTFCKLNEILKPGGVYIIEDCNAVAQNDYTKKDRIHAIIEREKERLAGWDLNWVSSKSAGPKSSLILIRNK